MRGGSRGGGGGGGRGGRGGGGGTAPPTGSSASRYARYAGVPRAELLRTLLHTVERTDPEQAAVFRRTLDTLPDAQLREMVEAQFGVVRADADATRAPDLAGDAGEVRRIVYELTRPGELHVEAGQRAFHYLFVELDFSSTSASLSREARLTLVSWDKQRQTAQELS